MAVGGTGVTVTVTVAVGIEVGGDAVWLLWLKPASKVAAIATIRQRLMVLSSLLEKGVYDVEFGRVGESKRGGGWSDRECENSMQISKVRDAHIMILT